MNKLTQDTGISFNAFRTKCNNIEQYVGQLECIRFGENACWTQKQCERGRLKELLNSVLRSACMYRLLSRQGRRLAWLSGLFSLVPLPHPSLFTHCRIEQDTG